MSELTNSSVYKFPTKTELEHQCKINALKEIENASKEIQNALLQEGYFIYHTDIPGLEMNFEGYSLITNKKLLHHDQDCNETFHCDKEKNCRFSKKQCLGIFITKECKKKWTEKDSCQQNREKNRHDNFIIELLREHLPFVGRTIFVCVYIYLILLINK